VLARVELEAQRAPAGPRQRPVALRVEPEPRLVRGHVRPGERRDLPAPVARYGRVPDALRPADAAQDVLPLGGVGVREVAAVDAGAVEQGQRGLEAERPLVLELDPSVALARKEDVLRARALGQL